VETGQRPEWKDIADRYWAQWKLLAVRNGILERNWEFTDGRFTIAQRVIPRSKVKDVLTELHSGPSLSHLGFNVMMNKVRHDSTGSKQDQIFRNAADSATSVKPVGALFERIAIDIAEPFPRSDQRNIHLLISIDYFTKWPEVYVIPIQEASTVAEALVANFYCRFSILR
jgi:hypothetical protein